MHVRDNIQITAIPALKDNYIWIIIDQSTKNALIIDPGDAEPVNDYLEQHHLNLIGILLTHHHADHTNGAQALKEQHEALVLGPLKETIEAVDVRVHAGEKYKVHSFPLRFDVLDIPGHTIGHVAYLTKDHLFCGDTLFAAGCGRLFEGSPLQLYTALQKIAALPSTTQIYCGHEYTQANLQFAHTIEPGNVAILERMQKVNALRLQSRPSLPSTIAEERETNPFLRCEKPEVIASVEGYAGHRLKKPLEVFTWLRKWKDHF